MTSHEPVSAQTSHGGAWLRLTLHHPKGNIVTLEMLAALRRALAAVASGSPVKIVTLEGSGADFSYGASVEEHRPGEIDHVLPEMHRLVMDLLQLGAPTAAIVRGRCLGGGFEIALACDFLFASEDAVLGLPEIALGVFPPAGATLLPLRVGYARATRAVLTGQPRPASEWVPSGLIEFTAPAPALVGKVERWVETHLLPRSAAALAYAARAVRAGLVDHAARTLPALERTYLTGLMQTADAVEGVSAFLEKRQPAWQNR
jgi:cyclohexa-1,5-dienecarbonyl-CoA hydratase